MHTIRARVPLAFFQGLYPCSAELLKGNSMIVRAVGVQSRDGSILRSRGYLLFGNGLATLLVEAWHRTKGVESNYDMDFTRRVNDKRVEYWEIQGRGPQSQEALWVLQSSTTKPPANGKCTTLLCFVEGRPGQYLYLSRTA